jgi:hypothetical protein
MRPLSLSNIAHFNCGTSAAFRRPVWISNGLSQGVMAAVAASLVSIWTGDRAT